ncbi:hypothetical protein KIW84_014329 [Lathyrus oleraceus]|uniref:Uncharacterized protein n=1 Tax=Pisum sativum TaxID=3888 RepID=A0A9D5BMQ2_PEA|nr:hypothetical protein KIW84_014329 [Pisum sativum]
MSGTSGLGSRTWIWSVRLNYMFTNSRYRMHGVSLHNVLYDPISTYCLACWVFRIEMAGRGRDDAAIAEALGMLAGVLGGNPNVVGMGAARQLSEFQKNNPPMFKGAYDPDGA